MTPHRLAVACAATVLLPLAACSADPGPTAAPAPPSPTATSSATPARPSTASARPSASPRPSPSPAPRPVDPLRGLNPLTGHRASGPTHPVVVLKVDNAPLAQRYQRGLDRAAVVYVELIEGGSTRFAAVYDDAPANEVGPIRSARGTDVQLLGQYGPVALGYSGANTGTRRAIAKAVKAHRLNDASFYRFPGAYRLAERRADARNFFTRPSRLAAARAGAARPRDVGLRFGPLPKGAGLATRSLSARFSPYSTFTATWDAGARLWQVREGSRRVARVANVVVQRVRIAKTRYRDTLGNPTPFSQTLGRGGVAVLRDGRRVPGTWARAGLTAGTHYRDRAGRDIPLTPGRTWVLLVPAKMSVTVR